jgi:oligopeptidase B
MPYLHFHREFHTDVVRIRYKSFITPDSTFDYNMHTRQLTLLKEKEVLGGYDRTQYVSERIHATADDGVQVPISLVYKRTTAKDASGMVMVAKRCHTHLLLY